MTRGVVLKSIVARVVVLQNVVGSAVVLQNVVGLAVVVRAFLLQTVVARIVVQQNAVRSAVVARAAVEPNWDLHTARSGKQGPNVSKRDQFWDHYRGAGSGLFGAYFGAPVMPSANQTRIVIRLSLFLLASLWGLIMDQIGIEEYQNRALCSYSVSR